MGALRYRGDISRSSSLWQIFKIGIIYQTILFACCLRLPIVIAKLQISGLDFGPSGQLPSLLLLFELLLNTSHLAHRLNVRRTATPKIKPDRKFFPGQ